MSGTFPATPVPNAERIRSLQPTLVSITHSLKRQARTRGSQRWGIRLTWPQLRRASFAPLWAFVINQRGQFDTFQYVLSGVLKNAQGALGGAPVVDNEVGSPTIVPAGRTIYIKGASNSITGWGKAMDFFKFAGHSKVYQLSADVSTDGTGRAQLSFDPALVAAPAHGEALTFTNVPFTVALASDSQEFPLAVGSFFTLDLDLVEVY